jgi:hypothetical protein
LVEIAVVLGVVGLVVSGVWKVASSGRESVRRELAFDQVTILVKNVRAYFQGRASSVVSGVTTPANYTLFMIEQGVVPIEMVNRKTSPYVADLPWGNRFGATGSLFLCDGSSHCANGATNAIGDSTTASQSFTVRLSALPLGACVYLLGKLTGPGSPDGLKYVAVNASALYNPRTSGGYPISLTWARANCTSKLNNSIDLTYRLRLQVE